MNSQDEEIIIHPRREKGEPLLNRRGLLLINPAECSLGEKVIRERGGSTRALFNSRLSQLPLSGDDPPLWLAGPAVGAPMAVLLLEKLIALGAKEIIVYGWCGSLTPDLRIGDLLLPAWSKSEEGTSLHYPGGEKPASSPALNAQLMNWLTAKGLQFLQGGLWTTDAPYRETRAKVQAYAGQGLLAVDMEFSALCTVASFRGVHIAGLFLVSDELWQPRWAHGYRKAPFRRYSSNLLHLLLDFRL